MTQKEFVFALFVSFLSPLLRAGEIPLNFSIRIIESKQLAPASDMSVRPIVLACWSQGASKSRTVDDYLTELQGKAHTSSLPQSFADFIKGVTVKESGLDHLKPSISVFSTDKIQQSKNGRAVIYHAGLGGSLLDNFMLMELLASEGYLACSASFFPKDVYSFGINGELQTSLADMDVIANLLRSEDSKLEHIGVMGHSFGAQAALFTAIRRPSVAVVVMLDSTMDYPYSDEAFADTEIMKTINDEGSSLTAQVFATATDRAKPKIFAGMNYIGLNWLIIPKMEHEDFTSHGYLAHKGDEKSPVEKEYPALINRIKAFLAKAFNNTPRSPSAAKLAHMVLTKQAEKIPKLCAPCDSQTILDLMSSMQNNGAHGDIAKLDVWIAKTFPDSALVLYGLGQVFRSAEKKEPAKKYYEAALVALDKSKSKDVGVKKLRDLIQAKIKSLN